MAGWQGANPGELPAASLPGVVDVPLRKKALREELRRRIHENTRDSAAVVREVAAYLHQHPQCRVVALFAPLPGEVDLISLTGDAGRIWVFPKVEAGSLVFHQVRDPRMELNPGAFGILEPAPGLPPVHLAEIDLFLCPGLGFDERGGRIGRGKGFYDGTLAKARPNALKIGACFLHQILDEIPMEEHDIRMDGVIAG